MRRQDRQCLSHVDCGSSDLGKRGDSRPQLGGSERRVEVDVQADADQVGALDALAKQAGKFLAAVEQIIGPLELDAVVARSVPRRRCAASPAISGS